MLTGMPGALQGSNKFRPGAFAFQFDHQSLIRKRPPSNVHGFIRGVWVATS